MCSGTDKPLEEALLDKGGAVEGQLHGVLARKRVRRTKDGRHGIVKLFAVANEGAEDGRVRTSKSRSQRAIASGPETRMMASAPLPAGVDKAQMVGDGMLS